MSLGLIQEPVILSPVNNPLPIVFSSGDSGEDGFRYKVVLQNNKGDDTEVWIYPDTDYSNYCIFDFSMLMSDVITDDKDNWNTSGYTESYNSWASYNYDITEYIGSTSGDTYSSGTFYVFRGVKQYGKNWTSSDYIPRVGVTAEFLSNKIYYKYKTDEYATINTFYGAYDVSSAFNKVIIDLTDGDIFKRYYYENQLTGGHIRSIYTLPIGPANLNLMSNGGLIIYSGATLTPVVGDLIDTTSSYYNVHLQYDSDIVSETIKVNVDQNCYKHDGIQFLYLGELSTYETFSARMADIKGFSTKRSEVKKNYNNYNGTNYGYYLGDRGRDVVNITTQEEHEAYTDWIKDDESTDLMEFFNSPDVYIIKDDGIYPIIITTKSYEQKTIRNNRLFNYKIGFEMAYEKLSNI